MVNYEVVEGQLLFRPKGDLTFFNVAPLSQEILGAINETGASDVIVDCTAVNLLDSAALGSFAKLARTLSKDGGLVKLTNVGNHLHRNLTSVRIDRLLKVFDTVDAAVNYREDHAEGGK